MVVRWRLLLRRSWPTTRPPTRRRNKNQKKIKSSKEQKAKKLTFLNTLFPSQIMVKKCTIYFKQTKKSIILFLCN
jgi:hypothetical protein